jgi:hypothetical protein
MKWTIPFVEIKPSEETGDIKWLDGVKMENTWTRIKVVWVATLG